MKTLLSLDSPLSRFRYKECLVWGSDVHVRLNNQENCEVSSLRVFSLDFPTLLFKFVLSNRSQPLIEELPIEVDLPYGLEPIKDYVRLHSKKVDSCNHMSYYSYMTAPRPDTQLAIKEIESIDKTIATLMGVEYNWGGI